MSLGKVPTDEDLDGSNRAFCEERLSDTSIYRLLAREGQRLFPDEAFADLFDDIGRCSIPPQIVSVVMALQRIEGLSDRDAVERFTFDARWKYAAGGLDFDHPGFVHTVLVDMRARLRESGRPNRLFEAALEVARAAGLVGRKRVLDSTALYDAVATQDTVTLIRSSIRALLRVADTEVETELRSVLKRDDDYAAPGKPACDWEDADAREALVDALARDAHAAIGCLHGRKLEPEVDQAAQLVATVVGQDLEQRQDGLFRIARRVAKDRVISTVDPQARHGHKTAARGFDGYKGHISVDPDSEIIVATEVTPGNTADGSAAPALLEEVLSPKTPESPIQSNRSEADEEHTPPLASALSEASPALELGPSETVEVQELQPAPAPPEASCELEVSLQEPIEIYGDSSYGTAELIERIECAGAEANVKVQGPSAPAGMFSKDDFRIDLNAGTVTCPAGALVQIRRSKDDGGLASFGSRCTGCPLRSQCTDSKEGRTIRLHPHEQTLQRSRERQKDPTWKARYRATRPKVERKFGHLMFRRHGGRRARMRGCLRVGHDFALLCAGANLKRLAALGVHHNGTAWVR